ncbi:MAG: hypothetical protein ACXACI_12255, partial [Candidatus Hodarchaeales archaeon]
MSSLNRTLKLLYIFYAVRSLWFFIPIWALFLYETLEIDIFLITVLDIAFWVTIAIAEIPTGT